MAGVILLGVFVVLLICGAPIAVCLGMSSVAAMLVQGAGKPIVAVMSVLPRICSASSSKFVLLAIPFFIISGNVMEKAGISGRLINLAEKCLGHIKGGMAMVCIVVSCFFAAISGSGSSAWTDHDPGTGESRISGSILLCINGSRWSNRSSNSTVYHIRSIWFHC